MMSSREFEIEIAVKIALLEPSAIVKLGELERLATIVSAKAADKAPKIMIDLLFSQLSRYMGDVLGFSPVSQPPRGGRAAVNGHSDWRSADASAVVQQLMGFITTSALAEPSSISPVVFDQLKMLLERLFELVESVHAVPELSDFGWQWDGLNVGWESGGRNSEYELSLVWRALRSGDVDWLPPKDPAGSGHLPDFITYWFSASAVVLGHLAWSDPSIGIARWVNFGMPGDGGVLSGLKRLYGADMAALILNAHVPELAQEVTAMASNVGGPSPEGFDSPTRWLENPDIAMAVGTNRRWSAMLCGGSDSLHLRDHLRVLLLGASPQEVRLSGGSAAAATQHVHLLLADGCGWYETLQRNGDRLPSRPDGRAWRVDVTSATLGYIGEFRKSRATGRWFAGKHSSHMLGN